MEVDSITITTYIEQGTFNLITITAFAFSFNWGMLYELSYGLKNIKKSEIQRHQVVELVAKPIKMQRHF